MGASSTHMGGSVTEALKLMSDDTHDDMINLGRSLGI